MIERNRKKIAIIFWCVVVIFGLGLGAARSIFELSDRESLLLFGVMALAIAGFVFTWSFLWFKEFTGRLEELKPMLREDPSQYILENEKLLVNRRDNVLRIVLQVNIFLAYCKKGDYQTAKAKLLEVNTRKLHGINRVVYAGDLAYVCFYLGEQEQMLQIMEENRQMILKYADRPQTSGVIAILNIFEQIAKGELERARELYTEAKLKWENEDTEDDFEYLQNRLNIS